MTNEELKDAVILKDDEMDKAAKLGSRFSDIATFMKAFREQREPMSAFWRKWSKKIITLEKKELAKIGGKGLKTK